MNEGDIQVLSWNGLVAGQWTAHTKTFEGNDRVASALHNNDRSFEAMVHVWALTQCNEFRHKEWANEQTKRTMVVATSNLSTSRLRTTAHSEATIQGT
jgi:hypothetical protein